MVQECVYQCFFSHQSNCKQLLPTKCINRNGFIYWELSCPMTLIVSWARNIIVRSIFLFLVSLQEQSFYWAENWQALPFRKPLAKCTKELFIIVHEFHLPILTVVMLCSCSNCGGYNTISLFRESSIMEEIYTISSTCMSLAIVLHKQCLLVIAFRQQMLGIQLHFRCPQSM